MVKKKEKFPTQQQAHKSSGTFCLYTDKNQSQESLKTPDVKDENPAAGHPSRLQPTLQKTSVQDCTSPAVSPRAGSVDICSMLLQSIKRAVVPCSRTGAARH